MGRRHSSTAPKSFFARGRRHGVLDSPPSSRPLRTAVALGRGRGTVLVCPSVPLAGDSARSSTRLLRSRRQHGAVEVDVLACDTLRSAKFSRHLVLHGRVTSDDGGWRATPLRPDLLAADGVAHGRPVEPGAAYGSYAVIGGVPGAAPRERRKYGACMIVAQYSSTRTRTLGRTRV